MSEPIPVDRGDAAMCECCNLPTVPEKVSGMGYVCPLCVLHYDDGANPRGPQHDVAWEHEQLTAVVQAAYGYFRRHQASDG